MTPTTEGFFTNCRADLKLGSGRITRKLQIFWRLEYKGWRKVAKTLNMLKDLQSQGGTITPNALKSETNQELNLTTEHGGIKLDLRIETHDIPTKLGGKGDFNPVRHMNVDLTPGRKSLPNSGL